jgi:hypothetical protein
VTSLLLLISLGSVIDVIRALVGNAFKSGRILAQNLFL